MPEYFYVKNCFFELVQQFYHATESGLRSQYSQRLSWSTVADKIKTIVSGKANYRGTQSWTCVVDERSARSGEMVSGCRR